MKLTLTIPGEPVAKGRPRFYNGHAITPAKTVNYETLVKEMWAVTHGSRFVPLDGPLIVAVIAYFSIPASWSKKKQNQALHGGIMPTKKPDCSNIVKSIEDALNNLAYKDDSQIVRLTIEKHYSDCPRVELQIESWVLNEGA